jgi:O-antigen/teichoic acid export membrane protein
MLKNQFKNSIIKKYIFFMSSKFYNLINYIGIDKTIFFTIITKFLQIFGGLFSIFFIVKFLNLDEQGFYYTFASLAALQVFFELGLNGIITQFVAHEKSFLIWRNNFILEGELLYLSRISSLLRLIVKWYLFFSIALFIFLISVGSSFFYHFDKSNGHVIWNIPWILLSFSTAISLIVTPFLSFIEGLGKVEEISKIRLLQQLTSLFILWFGLILGFKLFVLGIVGLISTISAIFMLLKNKKLFLYIWRIKITYKVNYINEIFPFQWKIAISWISGYFIFQFFNPIIFVTEGTLRAGQMGMTLVALGGILSLSFSWISTKIPKFTDYIAQKKYHLLDKLFFNSLVISSIINITALAFFYITIYLIRLFHFDIGHLEIADRFLDNTSLLLMMIPVFINHVVGSLAVYLRSHKKEPYLLYSIINALLICLCTLYFGNKYGLEGITYSYCLISIIFFPIAFYIFIFYRKKWHTI